MQIVYSKTFLLHENPFERKERLRAIKSYLDAYASPKYFSPARIREKDLLSVHSEQLLDFEKKLSLQSTGLVGDNFFQKNTFEIALLAVAAALKAARLSRHGFAFSLARPPGHHATRNSFGGFCYLNNIAFAVSTIKKEQGIERAMIVDFDLHHGNGIQNIFCSDESVYYLSLHQNPTHTFPFSGFPKENSFHIENVVLPDSMNDAAYLKLFEKCFNNAVKKFKPELLGISAGFDLFSMDSAVGNCLAIFNPKTFNSIGKILQKHFSGQAFAVLEGGYYLPKLGENVFQFLQAFE